MNPAMSRNSSRVAFRYRPNRQPTHDNFQTPTSALAPLLPYLPRDRTVWEPACGNGNIVRSLRKKGYKVIGTDIKTGTDFLSFRRSPLTGDPEFPESARPAPLGEVIVTNPPYSRGAKTPFIECCYSLGRPFALLLPLDALAGVERHGLYRKHGVEVLLLPERVDFEFPPEWGYMGKKSSSTFPVCWLCWQLLPQSLALAPPSEKLKTT